ncbi:MAG: hypothetical protein R2710_29970 [Acidimicrobiales bacterium]
MPSGELSIQEALRPSQPIEPRFARLHPVKLRQGIDERCGEPLLDIGETAERVGDRTPDHHTRSTFDDEKRGADDGLVVAKAECFRGAIEHGVEATEDPVFPRHVVGAARDLAERRPPDDEVLITERDTVGEVGVSTGELGHLHVAVEFGDVATQPGLEVRPVELVGRLRRVVSGVHARVHLTST